MFVFSQGGPKKGILEKNTLVKARPTTQKLQTQMQKSQEKEGQILSIISYHGVSYGDQFWRDTLYAEQLFAFSDTFLGIPLGPAKMR